MAKFECNLLGNIAAAILLGIHGLLGASVGEALGTTFRWLGAGGTAPGISNNALQWVLARLLFFP